MISVASLIIVGLFLGYYLLILFFERRMIRDPRDIIGKFFSVVLFYAGVSIVYFSLTGNPFLGESRETYDIYIFIIGFIALIWTIPELLGEFAFFKKFVRKGERRRKG